MILGEERMKSYVDRGNELIAKGKTKQAMNLMASGFTYYTGKVIRALVPFAEADEGMVSLILYHIANEIERHNPKAAEFRKGMEKCLTLPEIDFKSKKKKSNKE